jgi:hypothetical protein
MKENVLLTGRTVSGLKAPTQVDDQFTKINGGPGRACVHGWTSSSAISFSEWFFFFQ